MPPAPKDGVPHPNRWGLHRSMGGPQDTGAFADGAAVANGVPISIIVTLAGCIAWRHRFKASVAGTLSYEYLRPDRAGTVYTANNPANVAVVANTETKQEVTQHLGESRVKITFTPGGNGTITYSDFSEV